MMQGRIYQSVIAGFVFGSTLAVVPLAASAVATIDQPAPALSGKTADGKPISLDAYRGKTVVLEWTNHECPFVKKHYESGNMQKLQKDATAQGVVWLQVISSAPGKEGYVDGPTAIKLNSQRDAAPTATILDPEGNIGKLYGAQTTPHMYIINTQGQLVYKGGIDSIASSSKSDIAKADNYVRVALNEVAAGKKVTNASTKAYGCGVKYSS